MCETNMRHLSCTLLLMMIHNENIFRIVTSVKSESIPFFHIPQIGVVDLPILQQVTISNASEFKHEMYSILSPCVSQSNTSPIDLSSFGDSE